MNNHIAEFRLEMRWSQSVLGEKLGVSRQTINAIEAGRSYPSLPLVFKIARLFQRPIEQIFTPVEEPIVGGEQAVDSMETHLL